MRNRSISDYIQHDLKRYSVYTIKHRNIPSFYDGMTDVQRIILNNAPTSVVGTNTVIGDCTKSGYHHGDASLAGAIAKMCRISGNSRPLIAGDGFFGNSISPAASPRYTKCRIDKLTKSEIDKYAPVNELDEYGNPVYYNLPYPIGLNLNISGIATGYRSVILPRKSSDIEEYLAGDLSVSVDPHLEGFTGYIDALSDSKYRIGTKVYIDNKGNIRMEGMSPFMKYVTLIQKIKDVIGEYPRLVFRNNTKTEVDIVVVTRNRDRAIRKEIRDKLTKISSHVVSEDYVFVNQDGIVRYNTIYDYLDDYRVHLNHVKLKWMNYEIARDRALAGYNSSKLEYLLFMSEDGTKTRKEVNEFIGGFPKDHRDKLRSIPAYQINKQEMSETKSLIKTLNEAANDTEKDAALFKKSAQFTMWINSEGITFDNKN